MKIYVILGSVLLITAGIVSLVVGNWTVLTGALLGLVMVFTMDLAFDWSERYSQETERHRETLVGTRTVEATTYYDDDGNEILHNSSDMLPRKDPAGPETSEGQGK
ncbi:hypothetical protein GCM10027403_08230 [Arthrobacter tecti]